MSTRFIAVNEAASLPSTSTNRRRSARIRVLHVIQNLNYGGMERLIAEIVRRMDPQRFEPHVLALQFLGRFSDGLSDVATLHVAGPMTRLSMLRPASLSNRIAAIAPGAVHTHSGVWYKASLAARMAGVPKIIHTEHGRAKPDPLKSRIVDSLAAVRTDVVVAVSDQLGEQLIASRIAPPTRVRVVRNGVDIDAFKPRVDDGALRRVLGIPLGVPVLGSIGRLEPIKGYEVMIEAMRRAVHQWKDGPAPVLVIAGEGSERPRLERLIDDYSLRNNVRLLGWRDDAHALHSMFTLFTMSSHSEGTSVSLLEAMSAGLCPVVTDVGGNRAVLGERLIHRLVPPATPGALAGAWMDALQQKERSREDGLTARRQVASAFDLGSMVHAYEQLYEEPGRRAAARANGVDAG